ncbi:uncharacterized protein LOC136042565 [Artemia franciscana]|uniref:uncharacterized protein LOC136042565 n=1 Tax=Artemia franciscana TaxID=6661 RepID=UPI0032DB4E3C
MELGRTKMTSITKKILHKDKNSQIVAELKDSFFSLLLDESTDNTLDKYLCVLVKNTRKSDGKICTDLFGMIRLEPTNLSADGIFSQMREFFVGKNLSFNQIDGLACDVVSVMVGANNSVYQKLKDSKNLVLLKFICHSAHLCAAAGTAEIPKNVEEFVRMVVNYVSSSSKRTAILMKFQEYYKTTLNMLLKITDKRWLAAHQCIARLLDLWSALEQFFVLASAEDRQDAPDKILLEMKNPFTKAYFLFL